MSISNSRWRMYWSIATILLVAAAARATLGGFADGPRRFILSQDEMTTTLGAAAPCTGRGGPNCTDNSKVCSTTGCTTLNTICTINVGTCEALNTGGNSINDCSKDLAEGNCCAVCGGNCTYYYSGNPGINGNCINNDDTTNCITKNYCGAAMCNTYVCGETPPSAPTNPSTTSQ